MVGIVGIVDLVAAAIIVLFYFVFALDCLHCDFTVQFFRDPERVQWQLIQEVGIDADLQVPE